MVAVTYNAKPGDPTFTVWHGLKFEHGKPTDVPDNHPMLKAPVGGDGKPLKDDEGKMLPSPVEGNDWFSTPDKKAARKPKDGEPDSPGAYFAHANAWMSKVSTSGALKSRWDGEESMREKVGWGSDDQERMDAVMRPKFEALKRGENTV